jgi:Carboxypeptidase regulatory-like domain
LFGVYRTPGWGPFGPAKVNLTASGGEVKRYRCFLFVAVLALLGLAAVPARAQVDQGAIEGTCVDQSGAAVPGVSVQAKNLATGATYTVTSNTSGLFGFPVVLVGTYEIQAEKAGFATVTQRPVVVTVGGRVGLTLTMPVAAQATHVTVSGAAPIIETTQSAVATTVDSRQVANLPVNGRNFMDFVLLTPGVTYDYSRQGDISFAGQRGTLNSLLVDGSDNNNTFFGQALGRTGSGRAPYQFSEDAVQEFQVNSNSYSAEYGNAGGAVINVVTKSGTNQFHGAGFWFYRDRSMNANDLVSKNRGLTKAPYHFNQFGGDIGGPIVRDRAFFFFDYDGQRNTLPNVVFLNLPSNFALSSDTTVAGFQQAAINYLTARDASWSRTQNQDVYLGKVDIRLNANQLLTARWNSQRFRGANFENGGSQNALEHTGASNVTTDTITVSHTWTVSPTVVNVARLTWLRDDEPGAANSNNPEAVVRESGQTALTVGRNFFSPRFTNINRQEYGDTVSWVHGRHTWKFGASFLRDRIGNFFPGSFSGQFTFQSLECFGRSLAGMTDTCAAGDVSFSEAFGGIGTTGPLTKPNKYDESFFAQDEWRLRPNFTLNLGLRYDVEFLHQPETLNPSPTLLALGIHTNFINTDANNIAPRVGFAWSPLASNRLVVRGGFGVFYGRTTSITEATATSNNGLNIQNISFPFSEIPNYPDNICGAPTNTPSCAPPSGPGIAPSTPTLFIFSPDYVEPYVMQASFGIEYELTKDTALTISYLGVRGVHLTRSRDINLPTPTPTNIAIANTTTPLTYLKFVGARPIPGFFRVERFESTANSIYHGLTVQLQKRFSNNFQLAGAYTFGKVIDDSPDQTSVVPFTFDDAKMTQNPLNTSSDRGPGVSDQRHRFVLSGIWNLDYAQHLPRVARGFLGGWEVSGIFTAQSGEPYSGLLGFDLNGDSNSRTDRTPGLGRDTFATPRIVDLDARITRNVRLTETTKLQFIAEAFNLFNHANIIAVNNTQYSVSTKSSVCGVALTVASNCLVRNTSFGSPTTTFEAPVVGPRIVQLAMRFVF